MPAIELRQDEIGFYDPEAAKARRERMFGKTKPVLVHLPPPPPAPPAPPAPKVTEAQAKTPRPIRLRADNPPVEVDDTPSPEASGASVLIDAIIRKEMNTARDWLNVASMIGAPSMQRTEMRRRILAREIIAIVARVYNIEVNCIKSHRRMAEIVMPRQEAMWLCRKFTLLSLPEIGRQFGGRDHTTVLYAIRKMDVKIGEGVYEPRALSFVQELQDRLTAQADAASLAIAAE